MFTTTVVIKKQLAAEGWVVKSITPIDKGVMTDTFLMESGSKKYAVRCFPPFRAWLAKVEFEYLIEFNKHGIKTPIAVATNRDNATISYLIYTWVEGQTLGEIYDSLTGEQKLSVCDEVIDNYNKINDIPSRKYGRVVKGKMYEHSTWRHFLKWEIESSRRYFEHQKDKRHENICNGLYEYADKIPEPTPNLVWSDLSLDNIIISQKGNLAAFIDFEGMMTGDPLLGISYLKSQAPQHPFTNLLLSRYNKTNNPDVERRVDFYTVFRYIRLAPYASRCTPNGTNRKPIDEFLPYVKTIEDTFNQECRNRLKRFFYYMKTKLFIIGATIVLSITAIIVTCFLYEPTLSQSQVNVELKQPINKDMIEDLPSWFCISGNKLSTYKVIDDTDKRLLYSCIQGNDSIKDADAYKAIRQGIDELAYKSNTEFPNTWRLLLLTFCLVFLGCSARTIYDYVGWECYKGGQDMSTWWPWYVYRPFIGVPITSFLIVAFRTSLFSSLFTTKDLNTYLVISFLAGFAMMEFITMLRRASKAIFGE